MSYTSAFILLVTELVAIVSTIVVWKRCSQYRRKKQQQKKNSSIHDGVHVSYNSFVS